jgi:UDP-glucose 4-epimerase
VMESVKRVYGGEIDVRITGRRPGDAVAVVANSDLARREFGWAPQLDNLDGIVSDALSWERILATKNWPTRSGS